MRTNGVLPSLAKNMWVITFIVSGSLITCTAPAVNPGNNSPPNLRVGLVEHKSSVEFRIPGKVSFRNPDGGFVMRGAQSGDWRVEVVDPRPARIVYRLSIGTTKDRFRAEEIVLSAANKGLNSRIKKYDGPSFELPYLEKSVYQVLLNKEFDSEQEAMSYQRSIQHLTGSEIIVEPKSRSAGTLRFTHHQSDYSFDSRTAVGLTTDAIEILAVDVGSGFHWERQENRAYSGAIEFVIDDYGLITVINELSIEDYLKGVVPSEMPVGFPLEALKAQAIAARVEAVSKVGLRHPLQPFDLCDDVHCQVFSGRSGDKSPADRAVSSTRGIFMIHRRNIVEAFYASVCGGHTENNDNVWLMDAKPYLRGVLDRGGHGNSRLSESLREDRNVARWVESSPEVFCNTTLRDVPSSVEYSRKYFRWREQYERGALEEILKERTGEDFGTLKDLVPLKRGESGRIKELEVVGTKKSFVISRELPIRQALSKKTLFSACFTVTKTQVRNGIPGRFILRGAGWGHGVGMCQVGAAVMAHRGYKFDEILRHYYSGVALDTLY